MFVFKNTISTQKLDLRNPIFIYVFETESYNWLEDAASVNAGGEAGRLPDGHFNSNSCQVYRYVYNSVRRLHGRQAKKERFFQLKSWTRIKPDLCVRICQRNLPSQTAGVCLVSRSVSCSKAFVLVRQFAFDQKGRIPIFKTCSEMESRRCFVHIWGFPKCFFGCVSFFVARMLHFHKCTFRPGDFNDSQGFSKAYFFSDMIRKI